MKLLILLPILFFNAKAFATGPDETSAKILSQRERTTIVQTKEIIWRKEFQPNGIIHADASMKLENLGNRKESTVLSAINIGSCDLCDLVDELKSSDEVQASLDFLLYEETPIDWILGTPTGEPSYLTCVTRLTFENGLQLGSWYWTPLDPSACQ